MQVDGGTIVAVATVALTFIGHSIKNAVDARKNGQDYDSEYRKSMADENRRLRAEITEGRLREAVCAKEKNELEIEIQRLRMLVVTTQSRALAAEQAVLRISDRHERIKLKELPYDPSDEPPPQ